MPSATLHLQLESELPRELTIGAGTSLFICGWCFCPEARIRALDFLVAGEQQPVMAHGMPRLDPFRTFHQTVDPLATAGLTADPRSPQDPLFHSYRSGFWGIARIAAMEPHGDECHISLRAELDGGGEVVTEIARIGLVPLPDIPVAAWPKFGVGPRVAICMATYNPPPDLLTRQLDSIRSQAHTNWTCVISDDCSGTESYQAMQRIIGEDRRFALSRSPRRLGFYQNFERALSLAPTDADFVAMADQDDVWHRDKLETLVSVIADAQLVYSDARVVSRDGELLSTTWWSQRRKNHTDLLSLLVANAVTGAASMFRRELLDHALPFPPSQFAHYHDHWIGLVALALGEIEFVERALYDYVQHDGASLGHAGANQMTSLRDRFRYQRGPRERARMWRLHYFVDVCRLLQFATVLQMRCSREMSSNKRATLERFLDTDRSLRSLAALGLRGARELVGSTETLGAEWMLFHAFAWRRLLAVSTQERPQSRLRLDAVPPPSLVQRRGTAMSPVVRSVSDKIAPLRFAPSDRAPKRINILIPTIDLEHFFGGYIAKLNLAGRLAHRGSRVRIVTTDPVGPLPRNWRQALESYSGLNGLFDRVEVVFGRETASIEVSSDDGFIATTWWTAHIARAAVRASGGERFVYLIQEYEPFTFPMGSYAALASESYRFPHFALFSSELLRDYFRRHAIGVYANGPSDGDHESASFENAITAVEPPGLEELSDRDTRRLLFYARPEPHASRNMFELGVLALSRAQEQGVLEGWELRGIGTMQRSRRIVLGDGAAMELSPRSDQRSYATLLRQHDVGLALMYTPHPSLVPIEMASGGMLTVTNCFENKTPEAMTAISSNLVTVEPSIDGLVAGLREAVTGAADGSRRVQGSHVKWSRDWSQSFDEGLLQRVQAALEPADASSP